MIEIKETKKRLKLYTHTGKFTREDVLCAAFLRIVYPYCTIIRTSGLKSMAADPDLDGIIFASPEVEMLPVKKWKNGCPYNAFEWLVDEHLPELNLSDNGKILFRRMVMPKNSCLLISQALYSPLKRSDNFPSSLLFLQPQKFKESEDEQYWQSVNMTELLLKSCLEVAEGIGSDIKQDLDELTEQNVYVGFTFDSTVIPNKDPDCNPDTTLVQITPDVSFPQGESCFEVVLYDYQEDNEKLFSKKYDNLQMRRAGACIYVTTNDLEQLCSFLKFVKE